jgi:hypothetical protein
MSNEGEKGDLVARGRHQRGELVAVTVDGRFPLTESHLKNLFTPDLHFFKQKIKFSVAHSAHITES